MQGQRAEEGGFQESVVGSRCQIPFPGWGPLSMGALGLPEDGRGLERQGEPWCLAWGCGEQRAVIAAARGQGRWASWACLMGRWSSGQAWLTWLSRVSTSNLPDLLSAKPISAEVAEALAHQDLQVWLPVPQVGQL